MDEKTAEIIVEYIFTTLGEKFTTIIAYETGEVVASVSYDRAHVYLDRSYHTAVFHHPRAEWTGEGQKVNRCDR